MALPPRLPPPVAPYRADLPPNVVSGVPGVAPLPARWGVDTWVDTNDLPTKVAALTRQVGGAPAAAAAAAAASPSSPLPTVSHRRPSRPAGHHRHRHHRHHRRSTSGRPPPPPAPPTVSSSSAAAAVPPRADRATLYVLGWTLTPSRADVLGRLASFNTAPAPLSAAAAGMNAAFPAWAAAHAAAVTAAVNVVFFDYLTPAEVAAVSAAARRGGRTPAVAVARRIGARSGGGGGAAAAGLPPAE